MKKSNIIIILAIFILPLAMYYFTKTPVHIDEPANASSSMPKVIQFSSYMCHDCKKLEAEMSPLRQEYSGKVSFQKIDVASGTPDTQKLIENYNVTVVPTLVFLDKNGKRHYRTEGYVPEGQLRSYLNEIQ